MRIPVKGIHWTLAKLADGTQKIYWYAWKNGPRLHGEYGTPEFIASYNAAIAKRIPAPEGRLQSLIDGYQKSQKFLALRERTRSDYLKQIAIIEAEFGDFPLKALAARESWGEFMDWRDKLALKSVRQADYAWTVLALILAWARIAGASPSIHARKAAASITAPAPNSSGPSKTKLRSCNTRPRICTCRCCWHCGLDSGRAIYCV
jgi:hypothetical protein